MSETHGLEGMLRAILRFYTDYLRTMLVQLWGRQATRDLVRSSICRGSAVLLKTFGLGTKHADAATDKRLAFILQEPFKRGASDPFRSFQDLEGAR